MKESDRMYEEQRRRRFEEERRRNEEARRRAEQRQRQNEQWEQQRRYQSPFAFPSSSSSRAALATLGLTGDRVPPMAELKAAYRAAAMRSHPDRPQNRNRQREATAEFQRVKQAFDLLAQNATP